MQQGNVSFLQGFIAVVFLWCVQDRSRECVLSARLHCNSLVVVCAGQIKGMCPFCKASLQQSSCGVCRTALPCCGIWLRARGCTLWMLVTSFTPCASLPTDTGCALPRRPASRYSSFCLDSAIPEPAACRWLVQHLRHGSYITTRAGTAGS